MILATIDNADYPMTPNQRRYIYELIDSAILTPDQKEAYSMVMDKVDLTWNEAEDLIEELKGIQLDLVLQAGMGKLKEKDMKIANDIWTRRSNT